jgi:hypothetical protein
MVAMVSNTSTFISAQWKNLGGMVNLTLPLFISALPTRGVFAPGLPSIYLTLPLFQHFRHGQVSMHKQIHPALTLPLFISALPTLMTLQTKL